MHVEQTQTRTRWRNYSSL